MASNKTHTSIAYHFPPEYCLSHGWCNHSSKECTRNSSGHVNAATKGKPQVRNTQGLLYEEAGNNTVSNRTKLIQQKSLRVYTTGSPPSSTQHPHGKGMSNVGDDDHLGTTEFLATNIVPVKYGKFKIIPYGNTMHSTHKGMLKINGI